MWSEAAARTGRPIVFSAPSGAGKTTIIHRILEKFDNLAFSVSSTTRPRREGERDGVDYDFLSKEEFEHSIEEGDFIEYEHVHGYLYGTRASTVKPLLDSGVDVVFDLDVLGALSIRRLFPEAYLIYIDVLDREVLRERLEKRGREDAEEIERRLRRYDMERRYRKDFDLVVVNDDLEQAVREISEAIAKLRTVKER